MKHKTIDTPGKTTGFQEALKIVDDLLQKELQDYQGSHDRQRALALAYYLINKAMVDDLNTFFQNKRFEHVKI